MTQVIQIGTQRSLSEACDQSLALVDEAAGAARSRYITTTPGQSETYLEKASAAEAFLASEVSSPWVKDEAEAELILAKREEWRAKGAAIERVRIDTKTAIRGATSPGEAFTIAKEACATLAVL